MKRVNYLPSIISSALILLLTVAASNIEVSQDELVVEETLLH